MSTNAPVVEAHDRAISSPVTSRALWLGGVLILSLLLYYFIGIDQGATSLFGQDSHIHEFVHDARHFLGFPCH
ncbi:MULTISPECIES: CbtB domain-containing protein [Pseudofrankia]|uniref:CbtB domain-containing protein n=1 Tax=Pseudofrankia TaxID=2994363 RepID=UPI000234B45C|nr:MULTISPECIES: CbtB domain-containing protein [Pseudofrankia]